MMKGSNRLLQIMVFTSIVLVLAPHDQAVAPDLEIDGDVRFLPIDPRVHTMYDTDTTSIIVTVNNIGLENVTDIVVEMRDENSQTSRVRLASLATGDSNTVTFAWDNPSAGQHLLTFTVDPDDTILEINENNNIISLEVSIVQTEAQDEPPPSFADETLWDVLPFIIPPLIIIGCFYYLITHKRKDR